MEIEQFRKTKNPHGAYILPEGIYNKIMHVNYILSLLLVSSLMKITKVSLGNMKFWFGLTGNFSNELEKISLRPSFWNENWKEQGIAVRMSEGGP